MPLTHVKTMDDYLKLLEDSKTKLVVIDFTAAWCGPCRYIGPIFEQMSEECAGVIFAKVDVDEADDVAARCEIRAMPTFQYYKGREKISEVMGADETAIRAQIEKHA